MKDFLDICSSSAQDIKVKIMIEEIMNEILKIRFCPLRKLIQGRKGAYFINMHLIVDLINQKIEPVKFIN